MDRAELLTSELVTNAVRHGSGPISMRLKTDPEGGVCVCVGDSDVHLPVLNDSAPMDESGRGISMVEAMSDDWGIDLTDGGKVVWFKLRK